VPPDPTVARCRSTMYTRCVPSMGIQATDCQKVRSPCIRSVINCSKHRLALHPLPDAVLHKPATPGNVSDAGECAIHSAFREATLAPLPSPSSMRLLLPGMSHACVPCFHQAPSTTNFLPSTIFFLPPTHHDTTPIDLDNPCPFPPAT
jgi:hypothetical protein